MASCEINEDVVKDNLSESIMVYCHYEDVVHVMTLKKRTTLVDIFSKIRRKWEEVNPITHTLQYEVPNDKIPVVILNDEDVLEMIRLNLLWEVTICKMVVVPVEEANKRRRICEEIEVERHIESSTCENPGMHAHKSAIEGVGQKFEDANQFQRVVKNYCIANQRGFKFKKNDSKKIIVVCTTTGCGWRIYAAFLKTDYTFAIRKCSLQHTCGVDNLLSREHPRADSNWVASIIKAKLIYEPSYKPCHAMTDIQREYGVEMKYHRVWHGKELAMVEIHGRDGSSFEKLQWYCNAVRETNPGSIAELEIFTDTNKFRRIFICFGACISGFLQGCRPILFIDGTHVKSKWKGCMLSAVSKDANNGLFTVVYAVVDAETEDNWVWFCKKLHDTVQFRNAGMTRWGEYTFFTDRHPGLMKTISDVFRGSNHAICLRHLVDNFKTQILRKHPGYNTKHWCSLLKKAAYALTFDEHQRHINDIIKAIPAAGEFIKRLEPERWANTVFPGNRWGEINNNAVESWNSWVLEARKLPLLPMVDTIRKQIMKMMSERRENASTMAGELCNVAEYILRVNYAESRSLKLQQSSFFVFEVEDMGKSLAVDLSRRTCSCREWQIYKIPCKHACACIEKVHHRAYDYVDPYYRVTSYVSTYMGCIKPIPTIGLESYSQENMPIGPPDVRPQSGRRKSKRFASQVEQSKTKCRLCGLREHNRRTCAQARVS